MRRSSRPRIRPVEFWNFEVPDYSVSQDISYKESAHFNLKGGGQEKRSSTDGTSNWPKPNGVKSDSSKTVRSKRKKPLDEDEPSSTTRTEKCRSIYRLKSPRVVLKKLKTSLDKKGAQNKHSTESESNDSGITDLDTPYAQSVTSDTRLMELSGEISSIHPDSESFFNVLNLQPTSTQKPSPNKENNYSRTQKSLNFKDAFSSNTLNMENVNGCFSAPLTGPKKPKKGLAFRPVLGSVAEERDESMQLNSINQDTTPKKNSVLVRSRLLNLYCSEDAAPETCEESRVDIPEQIISRSVSDKMPAISSAIDKRTSLSSKNSARKTSDNVRTGTSLSSVKSSQRELKESSQKENAKSKIDGSVGTINKKGSRQLEQSYEKQSREETSDANVSIVHKRGAKKNDTVTTKNSVPDMQCTNETVRRSSRIRLKPLEYWNFETAEVKRLENGEVSIIYNKLNDPSSTINMTKASVPVHPAFARKGRKCDCDTEWPPDFAEFKSLRFIEWATDEFKCYVARNYLDVRNQVYAGFLFLQKGKMMWVTSKTTTLFVICGHGLLKVLHSPSEGEEIVLEEKVKTTIPLGKKVCLEVEGSEMLKLFLALQNATP